MFINAGDFKQALVEHYYAKRAKRNARSHLNLIHVVDLEMAGLFNPVFNERIAQGMLGIGLRKIGPFDYETIFAHVASIFTSRVGLTLSPWSVTIQQNNLRKDVQFGEHQPGGLADSSRWLKRSENHRNQSEKSRTTKWCKNMK